MPLAIDSHPLRIEFYINMNCYTKLFTLAFLFMGISCGESPNINESKTISVNKHISNSGTAILNLDNNKEKIKKKEESLKKIIIKPIEAVDSKELYEIINKNSSFLDKYINEISKLYGKDINHTKLNINQMAENEEFQEFGIYYEGELAGIIGIDNPDEQESMSLDFYYCRRNDDPKFRKKGIIYLAIYEIINSNVYGKPKIKFKRKFRNRYSFNIAFLKENKESENVAKNLRFKPMDPQEAYSSWIYSEKIQDCKLYHINFEEWDQNKDLIGIEKRVS